MVSQLVVIVLSAVAGVTVLGLGYGVWRAANPERTTRDRLEDLAGRSPNAVFEIQRPQESSRLTQAISRFASPTDEDELSALRQRLLQAGYRGRNLVETYSMTRFGLAVVFPTLYALTGPIDLASVGGGGLLLGFAAFGYYLPALIVSNRLEHRRRDLMNAFPDALDLLVTSVESGLGLDAAFRRVSDELDDAAPALSAELRMVNHEMGHGIGRVQALKNLGTRTGLEEFQALCNVLIQAERFGVPVAESLRVHSNMVRIRRMQLAEERAATISPKLTVAMILFVMPCLMVVLVGPAAVQVKNVLLPTLAGQ